MKNKVMILFLAVVILATMVFALQEFVPSVTTTPASINEDVATNVSFTVLNKNVTLNITQVIITAPSGYGFNIANSTYGTQGTNLSVASTSVSIGFTGVNGTSVTWANSTGFLNASNAVGAFNITVTVATPGNYTWTITTVDTNGSSASNSSMWMYVNDTEVPRFSTVPVNQSTYYDAEFSYDIDAIDNSPSSINYTLNDTRFAIGSTGIITNNTRLGVTVYTLNITVNDTTGNRKWTNITVNVSQSTRKLNITSAVSITFETASSVIGGNCTVTYLNCSLYRNGTLINYTDYTLTNVKDWTILGAGTYLYVFNTTGNANYTNSTTSTSVLTVTKAAGTAALYLNNSQKNIVVALNTNISVDAKIMNARDSTGNITLYKDGVQVISNTTNNLTSSFNISAVGRYNITAIYFGNNNYTSDAKTLWIDVVNTTVQTIISSATTVVYQDVTSVVVNGTGTPMSAITIPSNITTSTNVQLDLLALLNTTTYNVTIPNELAIVRKANVTTNTNITVYIPANTVISADVSWDGKITLPMINSTTAFSPPAVGSYPTSIDTVVGVGSSVELNFSSAVKINLSGKAGKYVGWTRGNTNLLVIDYVCSNVTNPTLNSTVRECYIDNGTDLIIWTLHFTDFGTYTLGSITTSGGSGGGGSSTITTTSITLSETPQTYTQLSVNNKLAFTTGGSSHTLTVKSVASDRKSAVFIFASEPITFTLDVGQTRVIETNGEKIAVKLLSISNSKANVEISKVVETAKTPLVTLPATTKTVTTPTGEAVAEPAEEQEEVTPTAEKSEEKATTSAATWLVIVAIVIVIALAGYLVYLKKK